jgi:hypothetical protein
VWPSNLQRIPARPDRFCHLLGDHHSERPVKLRKDRSGAHVDVLGNGGVVCQMPLPCTPSLRPDGRCATATGTARGIGLGVPQRSIQMDCIMVGNEKRACGLQYRPN